MKSELKLKKACLHYRDKVIFNDLQLSLEKKTCACLLGPSGVGKTSLLRFIAGLIKPSKDFYVTGDIETDKPLNRGIAYMAQSDSLLPWLTVKHNVLIGQRLRGTQTKNSEEKALHLLETLGLQEASNQYPKDLSGGMRQRVAIARILLEDRDIVLLDEPFSSLDAITRHQLQTLLSQHLKNKTVLLVTHDPLEALRLGHVIYVMKGAPARLHKMRDLKGAPPRNLSHPELLEHQAHLLNELSQETSL